MNFTCALCQYFDRNNQTWGHCKRYPPVFVGEFDGEVVFDYPLLQANDWCGEYLSLESDT